jgi:hypothetical protein
MRSVHNAKAPKKGPVNLSTNNLSEVVETQLADYVVQSHAREYARGAALREAVETWNGVDERHGCFADEHSML